MRKVAHNARLAIMTKRNLLTTREVAERLNTTTSTVNRWVNAGKLSPSYELPGVTGPRLFDERDVVELANASAA